MKFHTLLMAAAITVAPLFVNAQRIKLVEGSVSPLKGITELNTEFTYDNVKVGEFSNEDDYIHKKTEEYNKKEAGKAN
ncbi:hypothetical protein SAMN05661012_02162 [Chitinophaga sancti]|uniref:Uncharacterized protein n=2 Tax=Chitinophaga sancti TaxID=1004 RepID=A0A1K1PSN0_9BACT|nr:hypothetical protein SAMN05661012_02162 [Chitinophaga sancti]